MTRFASSPTTRGAALVAAFLFCACGPTDATDLGAAVGGFDSSSNKGDDPNAVADYELYQNLEAGTMSVLGYNPAGDLLIGVLIAPTDVNQNGTLDDADQIVVETLWPEAARVVLAGNGTIIEGEFSPEVNALFQQIYTDFQSESGEGKADVGNIGCALNCGFAVFWAVTGNTFGLAINGSMCAFLLFGGMCF